MRRRFRMLVVAGPATVLVWAALFTVSWDRLAVIPVGPYSLKIPVVLFAAAAVFAVVSILRRRMSLPQPHVVVLLGLLLAVVYLFSALMAVDRVSAVLQFMTVLLGAIVPLLAVWLVVTDRARLVSALSAFIWGGVVAALFGIYQVVAPLIGLPVLLEYEALGGGLPRMSSFSYESGYFGYFLVLVIAAVFARDVLTGRPVSRLLPLFFVAVLLLANTRAVVFTLPLLALLLLLTRPARPLLRRLAWPVGIAAAAGAIVLVAVPGLAGSIAARVASVVDPTEPTSNAPRLEFFSAVLAVIREHLLLGVGPGNLLRVAQEYGLRTYDGATPNRYIVNNVWLQAMVDGGLLLLLAEIAFVVIVLVTLFRSSRPGSRVLIAGWITVIAVGGMLTSYYFDIKLWAVLGLALAAAVIPPPEPQMPGDTPAETSSEP